MSWEDNFQVPEPDYYPAWARKRRARHSCHDRTCGADDCLTCRPGADLEREDEPEDEEE